MFIEAKGGGSGGDSCSYSSCKAPVKSLPPTNQNPSFFTGRMPLLSHNEGKISHPMDLLTLNSPGGLPTLYLATIAPGYLGEVCHASHQPSDASTPINRSVLTLRMSGRSNLLSTQNISKKKAAKVETGVKLPSILDGQVKWSCLPFLLNNLPCRLRKMTVTHCH